MPYITLVECVVNASHDIGDNAPFPLNFEMQYRKRKMQKAIFAKRKARVACHFRSSIGKLITSFLDLNMKVIGNDAYTSVYDKRDGFGFPIVNFPWLSGDVRRPPSYDIYISQLVRFAWCCTSVLDFHSKHFQITSKLLTQGYRYHKLRKTFPWKFLRSYSEFLSKFGEISSQEYVSEGISHPVSSTVF